MTRAASCKDYKGEVSFGHPIRCGCSDHVLTLSERERRSEATARVVHGIPNGSFSYDCPNGYTCPDEGVCRCVEMRKRFDEIHAEHKWHVDLGSEPSFTVETLEVTLDRKEDRRYTFLPRNAHDELFSSSEKPSYIEVEGLEVVAPEDYQKVDILLICGDIPQIYVTAYPDRRSDEGGNLTNFRIGMSVPARQGWNVGVSFYDAPAGYSSKVCPAHVRLRITRKIR